ncbi:TetR family transcriptional regulator [Bacillus mycoides]|uniref:TetR family transcriptional regulator n=1 Tax=Bacillus mycoides TaxID=1405 RepID=A0A653WGM3_BACMY|nr:MULTISPECIES: TetR family transcriptional regulator [Bacillus cereus group]MDR4302765.1 TetR family transcriptional regulator [Bacillus mycoides]OTY15570.1 TetR family transcriptional regulator [Bacillus mycoides]VXC17931.1 TetR family transcriptional regulator [Bacillus mycoides]
MLCTFNVNIKHINLHNKNIDKHIVLKFLGTAVIGILESYILDEIDNDVEYVATQVGELMRRNI